MTEPHAISVVIPAYDEGERLPLFLRDLTNLGALVRHPKVEFLVVDDGSSAEHAGRHAAAVVDADREFRESGAPHRVKLVALPANQGKGAAVRKGWSEAQRDAEWLGFLDADGAVSAAEFWRLASMLRPEAAFDVLCGSRILIAGRAIRRSVFRHVQGRVFATMAERAFRLGFYDTQCGVKFVRAEHLRRVLPSLRERAWLLDVEMLALLQRAGARCLEEPIDWADAGASKVRFGIDALKMGFGLLRMRRRIASLRPAISVISRTVQSESEPRAAVAGRRR